MITPTTIVVALNLTDLTLSDIFFKNGPETTFKFIFESPMDDGIDTTKSCGNRTITNKAVEMISFVH